MAAWFSAGSCCSGLVGTSVVDMYYPTVVLNKTLQGGAKSYSDRESKGQCKRDESPLLTQLSNVSFALTCESIDGLVLFCGADSL